MKKKIILMVMIALTAFMVYAAGNQDNSVKKEDSLRVKCVSWIAKKAFVSQAVENFKKDNPDITVTLELIDEVNAQTQSILWAAGKTDCDIFIGIDPATTPNFVAQDYVYTMEDLKFWDKYSRDHFVAGPLKECTFGSGTRYLPLLAEMNWYNINTEQLKEAGIMKGDTVPVPESWEQINEWSRILKDKFGRPMNSLSLAPAYWIVDGFYGAVQGLMGNKYEADGVTLITDSPEIREILKAWKAAWEEDLVLKSALTDSSAGRNSYAAGKIAMTYESNSRWIGKAKDIGVGKTAPMTIPGGMKNGSLMWIASIAVPKASESPELAQKFAMYILQDKYQLNMMKTYGKMAVTKSAYSEAGPEFDQMKLGLEKSLPHPMYKDFDIYYNKSADLLVGYITGKIDLDFCIDGMGKLIKSIDTSIVQ